MSSAERARLGFGIAFVCLLAHGALADDLHAPLDALLAKYVDTDGRVAYRTLAQQDAAVLDAYLGALAAADPAALAPPEQIAFWINAYNARVLRGVLDGYSAESFLGRKRFFSFYRFPLVGQERTLDEIEHQILRKRFGEPRLHFALVCASTSCPKLRREAYRGERLDAQLDEQARVFLDDPRRNQFGPGDVVHLSSIFKWFGDDFDQAAGSVPAFVRRYHALPEPARIEYLDYDWTMNAQPGQRLE
jgi:hypothetical protein